MSMKVVERSFFALLLALVLSAIGGCGKFEQQGALRPDSTQPGSTPTVASPSPEADKREIAQTESGQVSGPSRSPGEAPSAEELQKLITRIYKGAVVIETSRGPNFFSGDFNGDGSQDLAVIVKPADKMLAKLNSDIANWVIEDPQKVFVPDLHRGINVIPRKPPPVRASTGDQLIAIIHGYGDKGWRDPRATQTYLLKNAVGRDLEVKPKSQILLGGKREKTFPEIRGDVISEELAQKAALIYWSGGDYVLYREP